MDRVARLSDKERSELFSETAARMATTPAVVEKDFWVTWLLHRLFENQNLAQLLMFKGGTSLSKAYGLIERFSEDIDLILDWRILVRDDPLAERSRTQQEKLNEVINERAQAYIAGELLDMIAAEVAGICRCNTEADDPHVISVHYPAGHKDDYLRPSVRLEIGPLASWVPHEKRVITCYAAERFPELFKHPRCSVNVLKAERTFWEKATILHQEAHRPEGNVQPPRYSRHYYDLAKMAESPVKEVALANVRMLADVVEFKQRFYPRAWANYELAKPGSLRLVPEEPVLTSIENDYGAMKDMIFGSLPTFEEMIAVLNNLQNEING